MAWMKAARLLIVVIAGAGAAGTAYVFQAERGSAAVSPAIQNPPPAARSASSFIASLSELERSALGARMKGDPFATPIQRPAAAPAPAATAPSRPPLPAFPYKYAGTLKNANGVMEAFLLRDAELIPIKAGELLDGTWRIDALTQDRLEVTFVPAGERVSMALANLSGQVGAPVGQSGVAAYSQGAAVVAGVTPAPLTPRASSMASAALSGGFAVSPGAPAAAAGAPRLTANPSSSASPVAASGTTSTALGSQPPVTAARLGSEPPAQGSMPLGPAPSGSFPMGPTPSGKLGL